MKKIYDNYKHAIPLVVYAAIYLTWFVYLEQNVVKNYKIIHVAFDDVIPFLEIFVIPYYLWFLYVFFAVILLFFKDRADYYRTCLFLFTGMTVFLVVSTLFPNGQNLRPDMMPRNNFLTAMVQNIYNADTPTNIWPSIHVYNSIGAHLAIARNAKFGKIKWLRISSLLLSISIILSTVFIKQHSVFDMVTAFIMAAVMYGVVYKADVLVLFRNRLKKTAPQI